MTQQQIYNKIFHDWVVLLTGLNGKNVRPQKYRYGFTLTEPDGKPISFESAVAMFFCSIDGRDIANEYTNINQATALQRMSLSVTIVGEDADILVNKLKALSKTQISTDYLKKNNFAIFGKPSVIDTDHRYGVKYFYRKTVNFRFDTVIDYTVPNSTAVSNITDVPTSTDILK